MDVGTCMCGVVGDPLVICYEGCVGLLLGQRRYVLSLAPHNPTQYPCSFLLNVQTMTRADNLTIPEGIIIYLRQKQPIGSGLNSKTFVTQDGIFNTKISGLWLNTSFTDEQTETAAELKFTKHDGGFFLDPIDPACNLRFYVKMDGLFSKAAVYVDKSEYGTHLEGICGNCNDNHSDDYDILGENRDALNAPILLAEDTGYSYPTMSFP